MLRTVGLLILSNCFMTYAWYGHLKNNSVPLWKAILISWLIAFFEYCLMVPANRHGYLHGMTGFQLKITQEVIALFIFVLFAIFYLKEPFELKYMISIVCIIAAVYFAFK
ncbi:DMT family protein [Sediminibacterium soli]|uniref:DMT family protein n=1 Tax=Sediminibacterium soli TaxID=2698829 RepID=UPI00137A8599|nr:DMT family protein [Sediminibacterium soli]NCI46501.1 DMT family protein [Sediminibacterium soli]